LHFASDLKIIKSILRAKIFQMIYLCAVDKFDLNLNLERIAKKREKKIRWV